MKGQKLVKKNYQLWGREMKKKKVSMSVTTNILTSRKDRQRLKSWLGELTNLVNLSETDRKIIYILKKLKFCYYNEINKIVGKSVNFGLEKLVSAKLLTSNSLTLKNPNSLEIKQKFDEIDKKQGFGNHQKDKKTYYTINPDCRNFYEFFVTEDDFDEDFLNRVAERAARFDSFKKQVEARLKYEKSGRKPPQKPSTYKKFNEKVLPLIKREIVEKNLSRAQTLDLLSHYKKKLPALCSEIDEWTGIVWRRRDPKQWQTFIEHCKECVQAS